MPGIRLGTHWLWIGLLVSSSLFIGGTQQKAASPAEANWPYWRGPLYTGVSPTANPPITWSEPSNIKWKVKIPGSGTSTPIVWNNLVFIQTAVPAAKKSAQAGKQESRLSLVRGEPQRGGGGGFGGGGMQPTEAYQFTL